MATAEKSQGSSTTAAKKTEPKATPEPAKQEPKKAPSALRLTLNHQLLADAKNAENPELQFTHLHLLEGETSNPIKTTFLGKVQGECDNYLPLEDLTNEGSTEANTLIYFLQCWRAGQGMDVSVWRSATKVEVGTRLTDEAIGRGDELPRKTKRSITIDKDTAVRAGSLKALPGPAGDWPE